MNQTQQINNRSLTLLATASALIAVLISGCSIPGTGNSFAASRFSSGDLVVSSTGKPVSLKSAEVYGIDQLGSGETNPVHSMSPTTLASHTAMPASVESITLPSVQPQEFERPLYSSQNPSNRSSSLPTATGNVQSTVAAKIQPTSGSNGDFVYRAQSPTQDPNVRQTAYQYPEVQQQGAGGSVFSPNPQPGANYQSLNVGAPNTTSPLVYQNAPSGVATFPQNYADLDVYVSETQTGKFNFGGAYNSDNGIVGQITIDERNFDLWRFPRSFRDIVDGTAWRGAGQSFRLELSPGANVERYLVSFGEPYLFNTPVSLNLSAYLFTRQYFDWNEERLGARLALGYRLTPDLSVSAGVRAENVEISNLRAPGSSAELDSLVGDTDLYVGHVSLVRDTRDHPFLATQGSYLSMTYSQGFGEFDYGRGDIDYRRYRLMYQRPDGSGRHTLTMGTKLGFSGSQTPIFENYFAGGFSTIRGYDFRGASPVENGVRVGGEFQWLNTLEYMFPLTADDMIKGVVFCDFGTVEEEVELNSENFRVAPGFGFRVHMPAAGIGAPLAFDFAFPIASADSDEEKIFSFYLGVLK